MSVGSTSVKSVGKRAQRIQKPMMTEPSSRSARRYEDRRRLMRAPGPAMVAAPTDSVIWGQASDFQ
jgi:hypothetical protein